MGAAALGARHLRRRGHIVEVLFKEWNEALQTNLELRRGLFLKTFSRLRCPDMGEAGGNIIRFNKDSHIPPPESPHSEEEVPRVGCGLSDFWKEDGGVLLESMGLAVGKLFCCIVLPCSQLVDTIDAIDNIGTKMDLLHYRHSHNIKVSREVEFWVCPHADPAL